MEREFKRLVDCEVCNAEVYYQPSEEELDSSGLMSWEVFASIENAKDAHPEVREWLEISDEGIEAPIFLDCPYRHEGESHGE